MNLECLRDIIGEEDAAELGAVMAGLPSGATQLLQIIAASLLKSSEDSSEGVEVISDQWITGVTSATNQVLTVPTGSKGALITPYDGDIYFTLDGSNPTTGQAHYLSEKATLDIKNPAAFRFAAESATVSAYVTYYK